MDKSLATKLVAKKLIKEGTEVTARYKGIGLNGESAVFSSGIFTVNKIVPHDGDKIVLSVISTRDGLHRLITHVDIIEIDGMEPNRFASVYDIKADGKDAAIAKRRGRKPKDRSKPAA
jgi:hypothetical protein